MSAGERVGASPGRRWAVERGREARPQVSTNGAKAAHVARSGSIDSDYPEDVGLSIVVAAGPGNLRSE
jgi:hypothetical protein